MKRKIIFSLFLQSSIIFVFMADIFKLILRIDGWMRLSCFSFALSLIGSLYYQNYEKNQDGKIISFTSRKNKLSNKQNLNLFLASLIVGMIVAFIMGVILGQPWFGETIVSAIWFYIGACICIWREKVEK